MNNKILTIPNILTIFRLILIPFFVSLYLTGNEITAFIIFMVASFTDAVDGYIARRFNLISNLGKVLDPLADKALRFSAIVVLVLTDVLPQWILVIMLIFDLALIIASAILYKKKYVVYSNIYGKVASFVSIIGIILCFFASYVSPAHIIAMIISLMLVFVSIISYIIRYKKDKVKVVLKKA